MTTPEWIHEIKRRPFAAVAQALDIRPRGKSWAPCPSPRCGAEKRGHDSRAPIFLGGNGAWKCVLCDATGDNVDLVAFATIGCRYNDGSYDEKARVRQRAEELGLCAPDERGPGRERDVPRSVRPSVRTARSARRGAVTVDVAAELLSPTETGRFRPRDFAWRSGLAEEAIDRLRDDPEAEPARLYLRAGRGELPGGGDGRALPDDAVRKWKLGAFRAPDGGWWVTIPLLDPDTGDAVNVKYRRVPLPDGTCPKPKYTTCPDRPMPLFGVRALPDDLAAPVVIVEGELDVVALWAYGWQRGVVSSTTGAGSTWPDEWLDELEAYEHFTICYDDDPEDNAKARETVERGVASLIEKLGKDRCSTATLPRKDASECWIDGVAVDEVDRAISRARPVVGVELRSIGSYEEEFERRIENLDTLVGLPTWSGKMDDMFGGWPVGLTIITGHSGAGKTTMATWALLEQARHDVPSAITSFEQGQSGSIAKLMRAQLGEDFLDAGRDARHKAFRELDAIPIDVVDRYGRMPVDELVATIKYGRRRKGKRIWLIDHLGFLIDSGRDDERRQIDHVIRELTLIGNDLEVSILLVAHVDKGGQRSKVGGKERRVSIHDLKGSSSIEQDCALGLVVGVATRTKEPAAIVRADKVRGEWGRGSGSWATLFFDPAACVYADEWAQLPVARRTDLTPQDASEPVAGARSARRTTRGADGEPEDGDPADAAQPEGPADEPAEPVA